VFLSYAHESPEHERAVLAVADRLRGDGVDAWIDRYTAAPEEGWPRWVGDQLARADFVIALCTPAYRRAFEGRNMPNVGLGVNQEGYLITQALYDAGHRSRKYVAAAFTPSHDDVPGELRGQPFFRLPDEYDGLFRHVTGQPAITAPPLGNLRRLAPLAVQSAGNEHQDQLTQVLTPERQELARLAPSDGLFLSRLINPIRRESGDNVTTVWLTARGPLQYWIDSIRIRDYPQYGLGGNPVVTVPLDAEYRFTFEEGSDVVHALNPALSVGPETRSRVSFSVAATMTRFYNFGFVLLWVQYHASDGRTGAVALIQPPPDGVRLAALAESDVRVAFERVHDLPEIVVTAEGLQRGIEQQHLPPLCYLPVTFGWSTYQWGRERLEQLRATWHDALTRRQALTTWLKDQKRRAALRRWLLEEPGRMTADLTGAVADDEATNDLLQLARDPGHEALALNGLGVRHLVVGDDLLCRVLLDRVEWLRSRQLFDPRTDLFAAMAVAIASRPTAAWTDLLAAMSTQSPDLTARFLAATRADLPDDDVKRLEASLGPA
jgi:hypothetical protein